MNDPQELFSINEYDDIGRTALMNAAVNGQLNVVKYLISRGAKINQPEEYPIGSAPGPTAIYHAVCSGNTEIVKYLLSVGAKINAIVDSRHRKSIHIASQLGFFHIVKIQLQYNQRLVNEIDCFGNTPLRYAAAHGHEHIALLLIQFGGDLHLQSTEGLLPIDWAYRRGYISMVNLLIKHMFNKKKPAALLKYIKTQEQAQALMDQAPQEAQILFRQLAPHTLPHQLNITIQNGPEQKITYKIRGRTPSHIELHNLQTSQFSFFREAGHLNRQTRKFVDETTHQMCAVSDYSGAGSTLVKQVEFMRCASLPGYYNLFTMQDSTAQTTTHRLISPYFNGQPINIFFINTASKRALARAIFLITKELFKMHQKRIIHGNICNEDIWVYEDHDKKTCVSFLRFEHAYYTDQPTAVMDNEMKFMHWAPERRDLSKILKPHTNQDVFSLGYLLNKLLIKWSQNNPEETTLSKIFPSLFAFIEQSLDENPSNRPCLNIFYTNLYAEYIAYDFIQALEIKGLDLAELIFRENHELLHVDLIGNFFMRLIQNNQLLLARHVMQKRNDISMHSWIIGEYKDNILHILFNVPKDTFDIDFLLDLTEYCLRHSNTEEQLMELCQYKNTHNERPLDLAISHQHIKTIEKKIFEDPESIANILLYELKRTVPSIRP